jgi:hypothetical protein
MPIFDFSSIRRLDIAAGYDIERTFYSGKNPAAGGQWGEPVEII